jgi:hypothetical protein
VSQPSIRGQLIAVVAMLLTATTATTVVAHTGTSAGVASRAAAPCAGVQWLIGAMGDRSAAAIASLRPQAIALAAVRPPVAADLTHVVRLTVELVSHRVAADGSLSVVVSTVGKSDEALTVVFPSARCVDAAASGPAAAAVASARRTFEQGCGPGRGSVTGLVGSMTMDAVAMGRAELDPVTAVQRLSCRPAVSDGSHAAQGPGAQ